MAAPDLTTPLGRVRFALGDHGDTSLLVGGDTQYTALLTLSGGNEEAAFRTAALGLATYYASKVSQLSSQGDSLTWANRVKQWNDQARGKAPYPFAADGTGIAPSAFSVAGARSDGYNTSEAEYTS